jgi:hypothetical protein
VKLDEAKQLIASLVFVLVVTVFLLAFVGIRNVTTQAKPDSGKKGPAVACGRLVESWDIARGMRLDCEFDPSYTPPPLSRPGGVKGTGEGVLASAWKGYSPKFA